MSVLDAIIAQKKQEITSLPDVVCKRSSGPSFIDAVQERNPALIAEIKPKSPSCGELLKKDEIPKLVKMYSECAQAISVLCDEKFFGGGFGLLAEVRTMTDKPLLAKEFIIDRRQIEHAAKNGANAVLLITAILEVHELVELGTHAIDLNLDVLIEIHSREEIEKTAAAFGFLSKAQKRHVLLGINNRNLRTLKVEMGTTQKLAPFARERLPDIRCLIAESGIRSREDVVRLQPFVQGFLIGTSILKSNDAASHLTSLFAS